MTRVRVTVEREVQEALALRNRPFTLGLLLAPVGGAVGALVALLFQLYLSFVIAERLQRARVPLPADMTWLTLLLGTILGTAIAIPVTAILFPLMWRARSPRWLYPIAGALAGWVIDKVANCQFQGLTAGFVTGLLFMWVARPRRDPGDPPTA